MNDDVINIEHLKEKYPLVVKPIIFVFKIILFSLLSVILPVFILPLSLYISFKISFYKGEVNFVDNLIKLGMYLKKDDYYDEDDDDDDYEINENTFDDSEIELLHVEDIK